MSRVRVMVAGMPRMLADIVRTIVASQDDLEFAGEADGIAGIARAAKGAEPDVVILGGARSVSKAEYDSLLYTWPRVRIVAIAPDGRHAAFHELRPHVTQLGEVSPATLIAALRGRQEHLA